MLTTFPAARPPTGIAANIAAIPGLAELWAETLGDPAICVAVLDGPVDRAHECFQGADLGVAAATPPRETTGRMAAHGTHVASVIFGQHGSSVTGIAPACRGLLIPIFSDARNTPTPQSDLASAIQQALDGGAHLINISGGELSSSGRADALLQQAISTCEERGVLVIASAGNDACRCLHVPAALPTVLAVGAMDAQGVPLPMSNWGDAYQSQGLLAPGENIPGAAPGGGIALKTGTSFATPVVSGVIALLLSLQRQRGKSLTPAAVREALLSSATRCTHGASSACQQFLAGALNIPGAYHLLFSGAFAMSDVTLVTAGSAVVAAGEIGSEAAAAGVVAAAEPLPAPCAVSPAIRVESCSPRSGSSGDSIGAARSGSAVIASEGCGCSSNGRPKVYALGVIGYDFGTEARRDTFKQLMPSVRPDGMEGLIPHVPGDPDAPSPTYPIFPPNPYDAVQMVNYLCGYPRPRPPFPTDAGFPRLDYNGRIPPTQRHGDAFPPVNDPPADYLEHPADLAEASRLIWTLNIELTPVYAIRPAGLFAEQAYLKMVQALAGQVRPKKDPAYVSRVSIPAVLTGASVRLFSGQVVPVIEPQPRGIYAWDETNLINDALQTIAARTGIDMPAQLALSPEEMRLARADETSREDLEKSLKARKALTNFLNKIYYQLRNLGQTSAERALNYAATNMFQFTTIVEEEASNETELDTIEVERSAFCRMDSDCWDVKIRFFNPNDVRKSRTVHRYTVDVSDVMPVTVGDVRTWEVAI